MRRIPRILIDQSHSQAWATDADKAAEMNPANPADASYAAFLQTAEELGLGVEVNLDKAFSSELLSDFDLLVLPHAATSDWENTIGFGSPLLSAQEIATVKDFVAAGGGLLVLGETEQSKYGNNFNELISSYGIKLTNHTVQDPKHNFKSVPTWPKAEFPTLLLSDFKFMVHEVCLYRAGTIELTEEFNGEVILRSSESALPASAALAVALKSGNGRVVVIADSDLFGDDSIADLDNRQLLINILRWLTTQRQASPARASEARAELEANPAWIRMKQIVEELRPMQGKDGSLTEEADRSLAETLVRELISKLDELASRFAHQADYLAQVKVDLEGWINSGFGKPDFYDSLELFRPDLNRKDGVLNLAVFSMYTQNGNPNRNLEVLVTNTFWPDWLAQKEKKYSNSAFIPIEFVGFSAGYDTNSAVFFPETVAVREVATYHWGGIFCDREAARFRKVVSEAQALLHLPLPADAELLISDQLLAQETFVLWDLIHDRTHSRGDLPFDPFMIKQRMPFWMYALEELRCDLSTFRETLVLEIEGDRLAKFIRYAILFDRLFRFPITGGRIRNYDGLGGQILFAHLHKAGALHWHDNRLTFEWDKVTDAVVQLSDQVDALYHEGINRSRLAQWIAAYEFVTSLVPPHPASNWAKGADSLPTSGELKEVVNLVLDDEFPLNVFYETLNRKLSDVVLSTKGITA